MLVSVRVRVKSANAEFLKKRSFERRMTLLYAVLVVIALVIVSRLIELQVVRGMDYHELAQSQHFGGIVLPAKRGEILSRNSKTGETSILATNTTLDLLYVDPFVINDGYGDLADTLARILLTEEFDALCRQGNRACPTELTAFYSDAFDPLKTSPSLVTSGSGVLYEVMPQAEDGKIIPAGLPDITEARRLFARKIEERIREKNITFVPLLYGADKAQRAQVTELGISGIVVNEEQRLVYANPENVDQGSINRIARDLSRILVLDQDFIRERLRQRPLRYVPVMGRLPVELSTRIKELKEESALKAEQERKDLYERTGVWQETPNDPFRSVALIPEHWRYYPDTTIGSHVLGFINALQEPQYGVERTFDPLLRGQEGLLSTVSDPFGGQIVSNQQKLIDPRDGSTIVLTIDRFVQSKVESLLAEKVKEVDAESGQAIVMDPDSGRIIAMANAPVFDSNAYTTVYEKEPILLTPEEEQQIVIEVFHPVTNKRVLLAYLPDLTEEGRKSLTEQTQEILKEIEKLHDLKDVTRYYVLVGEHNKREVFPTEREGVWLKYSNNIGIGSYVNRTVQEIYEPGSVLKSIAMAIAVDQGEVVPGDIYNDTGPVVVDEFTIKNALLSYYGNVTMTQCIEFSINTCMTSVSKRLGKKLYYTMLLKFGFGRITNIELDNELPGEVRHWRDWSDAQLATASFGQGVTMTPLQIAVAYSALANGGKLLKPTIIDEIRHPYGTVEPTQTVVIEQVLKPESAQTMTAMLVSSANNGYAKSGKPNGYRVAGKTGTSQIAGPGGKYETGTGSTIATYAGYAPVDDPEFVILVKIDRPTRDDFGSKSAAPLFRDIAAFLFEYYGIPPDEN